MIYLWDRKALNTLDVLFFHGINKLLLVVEYNHTTFLVCLTLLVEPTLHDQLRVKEEIKPGS